MEAGALLKANSTYGVLPSALPCAGAQGDAGAGGLAGLGSFRSQRCKWESDTGVPVAKITLSWSPNSCISWLKVCKLIVWA